MRAFFLLMGLATAAPQIWYLLLLRGPEPLLPRRNAPISREWLFATAFRLISFAFIWDGARLFGVNSYNIVNPMMFSSWFAAVDACGDVLMQAIASVFFVGVYMRFRDWEV